MSDQSTQNPTPTVQVKEIGLPEQMSAGKVLAVAGIAAGAVAGLISLLAQEEEQPQSKAESGRDYLRNALAAAQSRDAAKDVKTRADRAEKSIRKQSRKAKKDYERAFRTAKKKGKGLENELLDRMSGALDQASGTSDLVKKESAHLMELLKSKSQDAEKKAVDFAEGTLMSKLREFGEEARVIAEEGKMRTADLTRKAEEEIIPKAKETATHGVELGKERYEEALKKAKDDLLPQAQKVGSELKDKASEAAEHFTSDATTRLSETSQIAQSKAHDATEAVKRGGRETRSLLMWLALGGMLIFTVFLDEDQQKKLKEIAVQVFGEARDMYSDMKGDNQS